MIAADRPRRAKARRPWTESIPDREERRRLKRQAILETAARAFVDRGFHETTLDDVASALAVTKPTLYYYVRSKEDILAQILEDALAAAQAMFDAAHREGSDGLGRLKLFTRLYVEAMTHPAGLCLLTMRSTPLAPVTRARLNAGFRRMDALARELVREGIADGSIAPCDVRMATFALFGAINTVPFWYHKSGSLTAEAAGDALFAVLELGLKNASGSKFNDVAQSRTATKSKRAAKSAAVARPSVVAKSSAVAKGAGSAASLAEAKPSPSRRSSAGRKESNP